MKNTVFIERMSYAIKKKGITQGRLSIRTKIPPQMISDYLNGKYAPRIVNLTKLANALDVSVEWLSGNDESEVITQVYNPINKYGERDIFKLGLHLQMLLEVDPMYVEKYFNLLAIIATLNYVGLEKLISYANDLSITGRYKLTLSDMDPNQKTIKGSTINKDVSEN